MDAALVDAAKARFHDCMQRADTARRQGDATAYQPLVEEFLFLSNASTAMVDEVQNREQAMPLPHLIVLHDNLALVDLIREGLLEFGFAAGVEPVRSLDVLSMKLDAFDATKPTLFVVTSQLRLNTGLTALHRIRNHPRTTGCPALVLAIQERETDRVIAMATGATAYEVLPDTIEGYAGLVGPIRALLDNNPARRQGQRGA